MVEEGESSEEAKRLLDEVADLRARTRRRRQGRRFPLLAFGLALVLSAPLYASANGAADARAAEAMLTVMTPLRGIAPHPQRSLAAIAVVMLSALLVVSGPGIDRALGLHLTETGSGLVDPRALVVLGAAVIVAGAGLGLRQHRLGRRP